MDDNDDWSVLKDFPAPEARQRPERINVFELSGFP